MTRTGRRWILAAAAAIVLVAAGWIGLRATLSWLFGAMPRQATCMGDGTSEELRLALEWGRLAPLPAGRSSCDVRVEGSAFTRAFRFEFVAPAVEVARWLEDSPGLRDARLEGAGNGRRRYVIRPGGGAQWAEAALRPESGGSIRVEVYAYWS